MEKQKRQSGSAIIIILILGTFIAVSLVWTMNYILFEKQMQEGRKARANFENFLSGLRNDLQDGYLCSQILGGQSFPSFSSLSGPIGPEIDIQIRNYRWQNLDGTTLDFPPPNYLRGDDPTTSSIDEGTDIPQLGIHIRRIRMRRGLLTPGSLPMLRPGGTTPQEQWGQDRWYRPVLNNGTATPLNYGSLITAVNGTAGLAAGTYPKGIDGVSVFGMVFAAELLIEPSLLGSNLAGIGSKKASTLYFNARDNTEPLRRIQLYVKATLAHRIGAPTWEPIIIGCYGPHTEAQLCDQTGGNFTTLPLLNNPKPVGGPPGPPIPNIGKYYCHPDLNCWTRKIPVPLPLGPGQAIFSGAAAQSECESPSGVISPFIADPLGAFSPQTYTCDWCNPNPIDPTPAATPQYINYRPQLPITPNPAQAPNVFGGAITIGSPYF